MPTNSQLTKIWNRLSARIKLSIEKQNSDRNMKKRPKRPAAVEMAVGGVDLVILDGRLQFVGHVADREEMDERGDDRDHHEHQRREHVDAVADEEPRAGLGGGRRAAVLRVRHDAGPQHPAAPAQIESRLLIPGFLVQFPDLRGKLASSLGVGLCR